MALLADKEQALPGTVPLAGVATAGAALAGEVRIHTDAATVIQSGFVGQQTTEFRKSPLRGVPVGFAGFGGNWHQVFALAALRAAFGPLTNTREVFQANQTVGMGVQDVLGDGMVGAQLEPSRLPGL